jgi:hypothetical protein
LRLFSSVSLRRGGRSSGRTVSICLRMQLPFQSSECTVLRPRQSYYRESPRPSSSAGSSRQPAVRRRGYALPTRASPRPSQSLRDVPPAKGRVLRFASRQPGPRASSRFGGADTRCQLELHHALRRASGTCNPRKAACFVLLLVSRGLAPARGSAARIRVANSSITTPFAEPQGRATRERPRASFCFSSAGSSR